MRIKQIKETALYVDDLDRTRRFYHEILGLPLIGQEEGRHVFFRAGTSVLLCFNPKATRKDENLPPHYGSGNQHIAFEVGHEEYDRAKENLQRQGVEIIHEQTWKGGLESFYFRDTEDNILEIVMEGIWDE